MSDCEVCRNYSECRLEEKDKVNTCGFVYPTELELAKKTKEYALGYEQGRADAINECISKIDKLTTYYAGDKEGNAITPKVVIKEDVIKVLEQLKEQRR